VAVSRIVGGILGGATGIAVMSVIFLMLEVETREQVQAFDAVARYVGMPGSTTLGFLIFAFVGTFIWPLLFVAVEPYLLFDDSPSNGMTLGALLWIAFFILGRGDLAGPLLVVFAGFTLAAHLAYGFLLGALYDRFADSADRPVDHATREVDSNQP